MQLNTQTYTQQTLPFGEVASTCSPVGSHANRSRKRANAGARTMNATCGARCLELLARFNHVGSWAKTFSGFLIGQKGWSSNRCALTWKLRATKSHRMYFQLRVSELHTNGTESSLLPTVQTQGLKRCNENGKTVFISLNLLPTPVACMDGIYADKHPENRHSKSIATMAEMGLLPTPCSSDTKRGTKSEHQASASSSMGLTGSRLNPRFIAEMMGFPPDWAETPFWAESDSPTQSTVSNQSEVSATP